MGINLLKSNDTTTTLPEMRDRVEKQTNWFFKHLVLQNSIPQKAIIVLVGLIWTMYFLWVNDWVAALTCFVATRIGSAFVMWYVDETPWLETGFGKLVRLHFHPWNIFAHYVGAAMLVYALWTHDVEWLLGSISVLLMGHFFGWSVFLKKDSAQA